MRVLTVISHPNPNSFTHALASEFCSGAESGGHTVEVADLHAEGFDPRWSMSDLEHNTVTPLPPDIRAEQARIERCDAICLAFPLFWFSMPAMMKGWMDRVWTYGWAYDQVNNPEHSLQRDRIGVLLVPAGGNPEHWEPYGFQEAMDVLWTKGMMGYFGMTDQRLHVLNGSEGSDERRAGLLQRAFQAGCDVGDRS